MKNMGLSELRLAAAQQQNNEIIRERAVNSLDIWENTRIFGNLNEAVADCALVVGTTRRRGQFRKSLSMTPRDLAQWLAQHPGPAAIVFGNERTGLEDHELDLCNFASHIPVSEKQPSLNLSHAVQVYAYEFFLAMEKQQPVKDQWTAMNQTDISTLADSITDILKDLGFYKFPNRDEQARFLRDVISRAGLMEREGEYLKNIFAKAVRLSDERLSDERLSDVRFAR